MPAEKPEIPEYSLYSKAHHLTLPQHRSFERKSFWGRLLFNKKPKVTEGKPFLLNLGCAYNTIPDWINADFFYYRLRFWKIPLQWMLDLRFPLNCESNFWDGVFTEHTLEHLHPADGANLLQELYRTMKPGAYLRIIVPDLHKYIQYYNGEIPNKTFLQWKSGAEAIRALTQNWGHLSVWDFRLLSRELLNAGFIDVKAVEFRQGSDLRLNIDSEGRTWESLYVEARKPTRR